MVEELLLPAIDLIGMDAVPSRQLRYRRLFAHRLQSDPSFECRIELPSRSAHHPLRLPPRNGTSLHLSRWSQNPGPLLAAATATTIDLGLTDAANGAGFHLGRPIPWSQEPGPPLPVGPASQHT